MARIYRSGERIEALNLAVRGGVTIVLSDPTEAFGLQTLMQAAGRDAAQSLGAIHDLLTREGDHLDLVGASRRTPNAPIDDWSTATANEVDRDPLRELLAAIGLAAAVWRNQPDCDSALSLTVSIRDPHARPEPLLQLHAENPGWAIYQGSLRATLILGAFTAGGFVVGVFTRGVGVERRAEAIVESLRRAQLERSPKVRLLDRIDRATPRSIAGKRGVILFLHGLLATDLGTFDVLMEDLRGRGFTPEEYLFLGWPHNTLTRIAANAEALASLIEYVWSETTEAPPRLAFVCHSRGGLLARYTAALLYERDAARWKSILAGCATFGTPHLGSDLADAPDNLIASFIAASAWKESGRLAALSDVLWVRKANQVLEGVEDLRTLAGKRPDGGRDPFQLTLAAKERAADIKFKRILRVFAVGGRLGPPPKWYHDLADRAFAKEAHDVAVPLASSAPAAQHRIQTAPVVTCDHFGYFDAEQRGSTQYNEVAEFLRFELNPPGSN